MSEIDKSRREMFDSEVKFNALLRQDLKKYEPVRPLPTADQIVGAEKNYIDFKIGIAETVVPYERLFADLALQEHLRQEPPPRFPLSKRFKVELLFEDGLSVLKYHKKKEGEEIGFIPDYYLLQYGKHDIKWKLEVNFAGGEINEATFNDHNNYSRRWPGLGYSLNLGRNGELPTFTKINHLKYDGRLVFVPERNILLGEGEREHEAMVPRNFVDTLKEILDRVPKWRK